MSDQDRKEEQEPRPGPSGKRLGQKSYNVKLRRVLLVDLEQEEETKLQAASTEKRPATFPESPSRRLKPASPEPRPGTSADSVGPHVIFRTPMPPLASLDAPEQPSSTDKKHLLPDNSEGIVVDSWSASSSDSSLELLIPTLQPPLPELADARGDKLLIGRGIPNPLLQKILASNPLLEKLLSNNYVLPETSKLTILKQIFPGINFDAIPGSQSDEDTHLQAMERQTMVASLGAKQGLFLNELLAMPAAEAADLYRNPELLIAAPSMDYGIMQPEDHRTKSEALLRPIKAIYQDLFRLVCLYRDGAPLSVLSISHPELFLVITADARLQVSKLRTPQYMEPWNNEEKAAALPLIAALSKVIGGFHRIVLQGSALKGMPEEVKEAISLLGLSHPPNEGAPLLIQKFMALAEEDVDAAILLLKDACFPNPKTVQEAYKGALPTSHMPQAIYAMNAYASEVTVLTCKKAQLLLKSGKGAVSQMAWMPQEGDCKVNPCKFRLDNSVIGTDLHNLDKQDHIFGQYKLKQAKLDRTLRNGNLECFATPYGPIMVVSKNTTEEQWNQMAKDSDIIGEIYRDGTCDLYMTPWKPDELYKRSPQAEAPINGFTSLSLGTLSGKILLIQVNSPGDGQPVERAIPKAVEDIINSPQVVKTGFGIVGDSRLKSIGLKPCNLVDLSNLVVLAFPPPLEVAPHQIQNSLHYYLEQSGSPVITFQFRQPLPGKPEQKAPPKANIKIHPNQKDFSKAYADWDEDMKIHLKVVHHGSMAILSALATKDMIEVGLSDEANALQFIHIILCLTEGKPRFGSIPKPTYVNWRPYGQGTVRAHLKQDLLFTAFRSAAASVFVHSGSAVLKMMEGYTRKFPLDHHCLSPEFALRLTELLGPLDQINYADILKVLFRKSNCMLHPCPHCGSTDHSLPTAKCLEIVQVCIYPQCLEDGHNIANCPMLLKRCSQCGRLGHLPSHHAKTMPQLLQEHLFGCLVHHQAYRVVYYLKMSVKPDGFTDAGQEKFFIKYRHYEDIDLATLPLKAEANVIIPDANKPA